MSTKLSSVLESKDAVLKTQHSYTHPSYEIVEKLEVVTVANTSAGSCAWARHTHTQVQAYTYSAHGKCDFWCMRSVDVCAQMGGVNAADIKKLKEA